MAHQHTSMGNGNTLTNTVANNSHCMALTITTTIFFFKTAAVDFKIIILKETWNHYFLQEVHASLLISHVGVKRRLHIMIHCV